MANKRTSDLALLTLLKANDMFSVQRPGSVEDNGVSLESLIAFIKSVISLEAIGAAVSYKGNAIPSGSPGALTVPSFWMGGPGTYTNYGGVVIPANNLGVISWTPGGGFSVVSISVGDLSAYLKIADLPSYINEQLMVSGTYQNVGFNKFTYANSYGVFNDLYFNFVFATVDTLAQQLIVNNVGSASSIRLIQFRKIDDVYKPIYNRTFGGVAVGKQTIDLSTYGIEVKIGDFFGLQNTASTFKLGREINLDAGTYKGKIIAGYSVNNSLTNDDVTTNLVNGIAFNYDVICFRTKIGDATNTANTAKSTADAVKLDLIAAQGSYYSDKTIVGFTQFGGSAGINVFGTLYYNQVFATKKTKAQTLDINFTAVETTNPAGVSLALVQFRQSGTNRIVISINTIRNFVVGRQQIDLSKMGISVEPGDSFALRSNGSTNKLAYTTGLSNTIVSSAIASYTTGATVTDDTVTANQTAGRAYNYDVICYSYIVDGLDALTKVVADNKSELLNKINIISKSNSGTQLYLDKFTSLSSEFTNSNWSIVTGGIKPTIEGSGAIGNSVLFQRPYDIDKRRIQLLVNIGANTRFLLFSRMNPNDGGSNTSGRMLEINTINNTVVFYNSYDGGTALPTVNATYNYTFTAGRDYLLQLDLNDLVGEAKFTITDMVSAATTLVFTQASVWRDCIGFATYSGLNAIVKKLEISTPYKKGLKGYFIGDSITEGRTSPLLPGQGWAQKAAVEIGSSATSGRGSGITRAFLQRLKSEAGYLFPEYIIMTFGTAGSITNLQESLQACIDYALSLGSKVILNDNIFQADGSLSTPKNAVVVAARASNNLPGANFYAALNTNNNPNGPRDLNLYITNDDTHPNVAGNDVLLLRLRADVPELFY